MKQRQFQSQLVYSINLMRLLLNIKNNLKTLSAKHLELEAKFNDYKAYAN